MSAAHDDEPVAGEPDVQALLSRTGAHVYSGRISPRGTLVTLAPGPGLASLLGRELAADESPTTAWEAAVHPEDQLDYRAAGADASGTVDLQYRLVGADGVTRWVRDQMWPRERHPDGGWYVEGLVTDVTEQYQRARDLDHAASQLRAAVSVSPAALVIMDLDGRVELWNPAAERLFGWNAAEAVGRVAPHVLESRRESFLAHIPAMVSGRPVAHREETIIVWDGSRRDVAVASALIRDADGAVTGLLDVITDISARKESERRLRQLAHTDPLTGLGNRALVLERLEEAARLLDLHEIDGLGVLLLDLDGFKAVNDSFGHSVGDELLVAVARRLASYLRPQDIAARLGGDEFAILLEGISHAEASLIAQRIVMAFAEPFGLGRAEVVVTASVGVVHVESGASAADLLRDADVAMYNAKAEGRNQATTFQPRMQERVVSRLRIENELRAALHSSQFELYYQPFVNLESGSVIGVEALARWRHPGRGLLAPSEFIDVVEDTGMIVPLGRWIIAEACAQAARWQPADPAQLVTVAVNLSPRQFHDADVVDYIGETLQRCGLAPSALTIEITENLLLSDATVAGDRIAALRSMGVQVAVDDFGTGYSSLAFLRSYPVDILKIDRSFVTPLTEGPRPAALVRSVIDLARALDMDTVAEGVELREQAGLLRELGCRVAQGYYFARPQPADRIAALLDRSSPLGADLLVD